ncbi:MAG: ABC transporter permease [Candidatus Micrarchaeota archaeon]|nr:ABC transporter permease [Candidatus Micrarchaeota archaeon]MDE1847925.1 ABC transporter permease [Candidatus Micrarchaeota archaeon]MDE1864829.1 ABC transporter permease [Candidatus Micrarchaeota archaeon]
MSLLTDSFTLFKREMLIFRSNLKVNLIRSIIFPLVFIVFFGNIGTSINNAPIVVVNSANNPQSLSFISDLQANNYLSISTITDEATALGMLQNGKIQIVVVILPTFPSSKQNVPGIQVYYSNTQQSVTGFALPIISAAAAKFDNNVQSVNKGPSASSNPSGGQVASNALYAANGNYKDFLVGGIVPMVVVFGSLFGGGISLISDRQLGNLKAFFITPINRSAIVLSRILSGSVVALLYAFLALLIGVLDGAQIAGGFETIAVIAIVAVILSCGFTSVALILASKIKRVDAYAIFSQVVGLPLWFISGGIIPVQSLPSFLAAVSVVDPLTYANTIIRALTLQGFIAFDVLLLNLGIISLFAIVFIFLCLKVFKSSSTEE